MQRAGGRKNAGTLSPALIFLLVNIWAYLRHPYQVHRFWRKTGRLPNIADPRKVQEKFQWRKIFDRNPLFTKVQDKLGAKEYARRKAAGIGIPATFWVGTDLADAPDAVLRAPGVLKPNQNCGKVVFLPAPDLDRDALRREAARWLRRGYGKRKGEWAYKNIPPRLFVEEKMENISGDRLYEIKVYYCSGKPTHAVCFTGRYSEAAASMVVMPDGSRNETPLANATPHGLFEVDPTFAEAVRAGRVLADGFDCIRVDFLVADGELYFGEFTVYPVSGFPTIQDRALLSAWSASWDLRKSWFLSTPQKGWRGLYARALRAHLDVRAGQGEIVRDGR